MGSNHFDGGGKSVTSLASSALVSDNPGLGGPPQPEAAGGLFAGGFPPIPCGQPDWPMDPTALAPRGSQHPCRMIICDQGTAASPDKWSSRRGLARESAGASPV